MPVIVNWNIQIFHILNKLYCFEAFADETFCNFASQKQIPA